MSGSDRKKGELPRDNSGHTFTPLPANAFRANVGIMIINAEGYVLAFERADYPGSWQLPQGGIDESETAHEAALRELEEETGIQPTDIADLMECPEWLAYELPKSLSGNHFVFLQSFRSIRRMDAHRRNAKALRFKHSQSLASLLHRFSQPMVRSTIQRLGRTTNAFAASDRFTISRLICFEMRYSAA